MTISIPVIAHHPTGWPTRVHLVRSSVDGPLLSARYCSDSSLSFHTGFLHTLMMLTRFFLVVGTDDSFCPLMVSLLPQVSNASGCLSSDRLAYSPPTRNPTIRAWRSASRFFGCRSTTPLSNADTIFVATLSPDARLPATITT